MTLSAVSVRLREEETGRRLDALAAGRKRKESII
jgi:predicted transcriptional regulator